jgi:hypothetical protein
MWYYNNRKFSAVLITNMLMNAVNASIRSA